MSNIVNSRNLCRIWFVKASLLGITICIFSPSQVSAQQHFLEIILSGEDSMAATRVINYKEKISSQKALAEINKVINLLHTNGYLESTVDTVIQDSLSTQAYIFVGKQYRWIFLQSDNVDPLILSQTNFREKKYLQKPLYIEELNKVQTQVLQYCENHGYPFAEIKLDSIFIDENKNVRASLVLDKNRLVLFDSLNLVNPINLRQAYLKNYLGIKEGGLYSEALVAKVSPRLNQLPFLREQQPFTIYFVEDKAKINLFVEEKPSSRFDFLLGFLPNGNTNGKLLITGNADLSLQNSLGAGETFNLSWNRLKTNTQQLELDFTYPYIFSLPFGVDLGLEIYRLDSSFLDVKTTLGIQYIFIGGNYLKAFYQTQNSILLSVDTTAIKNNQQLPTNLDLNYQQYGLEYKWRQLDNLISPTKGFSVKARGGVGIKTVKKNNQVTSLEDPFVPDFSYESLYDSINLKTAQYKLELGIDFFRPVFYGNVINLGLKSGAIFSDNVFFNELYRIGGQRILRGFNEQSIFASSYMVSTVEWRYLLDDNSYAFLFTDLAYVENKSYKNNSYNTPYGFGAGLAFDTKAGLFNVSYAYGSFDNKIDFRAAKIHFGYINLF